MPDGIATKDSPETITWYGWIDEDKDKGIKAHKTGYYVTTRNLIDATTVRMTNYSPEAQGWLDGILWNGIGFLVTFNGEVYCPTYGGLVDQKMYSKSKRWWWQYDEVNKAIKFGDTYLHKTLTYNLNLDDNACYLLGWNPENKRLAIRGITVKNYRLDVPSSKGGQAFCQGTYLNDECNGPGDPKEVAENLLDDEYTRVSASCPSILIGNTEIKMVSAYYVSIGDASVTNSELFSSSAFVANTSIITDPDPEDIKPKDDDPYNPESNDPPLNPGDRDWDSDEVPVPDDPNYSVIASGFVTLFKPYLAELQSLASYMWSDAFSLDSFKKLLADPMDALIGLTVIPVDAATAGRKAVSVAGISTDTTMGYVTDEWVTVECGTLNLTNKYGSYLDYAGLSKLTLFLPYIGARDINIDDVMGRSIGVTYKVNVLTGECIAFVMCVMTDGTHSILYEFNGQCGRNVALTASNFASLYSSTIQLVGSAVAAASGDVLGGVTSAVNATMGSKPDIEMSGNISGVAGHMGIQKPYLILHQPNQAVATRQNSFTGYPAFKTVNLTQGQGYTIIKDIHFKNFPGNDDELQELLSLLKGGVIL